VEALNLEDASLMPQGLERDASGDQGRGADEACPDG
jgi:hypothetical protein